MEKIIEFFTTPWTWLEDLMVLLFLGAPVLIWAGVMLFRTFIGDNPWDEYGR